jgi:transposase
MAMRRETGAQGDLMMSWAELPRSPGHAFYDRLQKVLLDAGFDAFVENVCKPYYASKMGAPSLPPGRYFRMHMVGYFEGLDSERGIVWRCADSFSLRDFLRLSTRDTVPDHSWLSKTRSRLPHEVHEQVFGFVLKLVTERGLIKGARIGVDGSTMEANAALRSIVRRDNGETYRGMLERMAKESGIKTPSAEDLARFDRKRKGKKLSNEDWTSSTDAEAKIARMKDGTTHLAYKPEHAVDLDTGVIVAAPIHEADRGDTTTLEETLEAAKANLSAVGLAPTRDDPCEIIADKGYHSRSILKDLDGGEWKSRISEPLPAKGYLRWQGDEAARDAVYANRARLKSGLGRDAMRKRGELVERSFAHVLDRGGMRRAWLRGRENIAKRYLIHVAGFNLGVLMRALTGRGTPKELVEAAKNALFIVVQKDLAFAIVIIAEFDGAPAMFALVATLEPA